MLHAMPVVTFIPCTKPELARPFYEGVLGLPFVGEDQFAVVFSAGDVMVRVVNVAGVSGHTAAQFTILGWMVPDIESMVRALGGKGVEFKQYPGMKQDPLGIWTSPSGARVAWFNDPFENVLSVTEH
jgi:catechol 2,3-dioxygenase-like lactoylglutathione lyase family enzyme